ncbi:TM2 domain containing protein [Carpediemonas membranifera]|uniref:TM2 domain containing protein n=1 Tax=Carpediemonas membranifera TaxID=201153 RepID=A0A8J6E0V0_9EUKA|nr:TM2 domain containing protein [Carpediemonas membranifera]|eukprot:KAG9395559.1 TM2 domain containing protein [Carpediemonas membranifera]
MRTMLAMCVFLVCITSCLAISCSDVPAYELHCDWSSTELCVVYGQEYSDLSCTAPSTIDCDGARTFLVNYTCQYCWQVNEAVCDDPTSCSFVGEGVETSCTVPETVFCNGTRTFSKMVPCLVESSKSWLVCVTLSVIAGSWGLDRLYLGHFWLFLAKLLTMGGWGLWSFVDLALIAFDIVRPEGEIW